jgi:hypothetical protein
MGSHRNVSFRYVDPVLDGTPMQKDQPASAQRPDTDNVVRLPRARPVPDDAVDLGDEEQSAGAVVRHEVTTVPDASTLSIEFDVLRLVRGQLNLNVHGPLSWASPLCVAILLFGLGAFVAAGLIQPGGTPALLRLAVAAAAGGAVLGAGVGAFIYCLHCVRGQIAR